MTAIEQAKAYALQKTGLKWERRDFWSDSDRSAFIAANAEFRRQNAALFTPAEQAAAANYQSVADSKAPQFSYVNATVDALGERVGEIGAKVGGVGEGIFSAFSLGRWLIPVAVVAVVFIWLWKFAGSPALSRSTRK